jgi:HSP20 family protein
MEKPSDEHPLEILHRQMNELFDDFFGETSRSGLLSEFPGRGVSAVSPRFEVAETDEAIQVTAELPGMDEKDIQVTLDENMLTVRGEKKQEREEKKKNYFFSERSYGLFERSLPVPAGIDPNTSGRPSRKGSGI